MEYPLRIRQELEKARYSRIIGNEGMARVCARRAAGFAVRQYLQTINEDKPLLNSYRLLSDSDIKRLLPMEVSPFLDHLTLKVDLNYNFPSEIDLINDAETIILILGNPERTMNDQRQE